VRVAPQKVSDGGKTKSGAIVPKQLEQVIENLPGFTPRIFFSTNEKKRKNPIIEWKFLVV